MFLAWEVLCGYLRYVLEHIMYGFLLPLGGISLSLDASYVLSGFKNSTRSLGRVDGKRKKEKRKPFQLFC